MPLGSPQHRAKRFALTARLLASVATALSGVPITADPAPPPCGRTTAPPPVWQHVVWIAFDHGGDTPVGGASHPPFLDDVEGQCGVAANYRAMPPRPPRPGRDGTDRLDVDALKQDLATDSLPPFAVLAPHPCHGNPDCSVAATDVWLRRVVARLTDSAAYRRGNTAIFVTDAFDGAPAVVISPSTAPGSRVDLPISDCALRRATRAMLGASDRRPHENDPDLRAAFNL